MEAEDQFGEMADEVSAPSVGAGEFAGVYFWEIFPCGTGGDHGGPVLLDVVQGFLTQTVFLCAVQEIGGPESGGLCAGGGFTFEIWDDDFLEHDICGLGGEIEKESEDLIVNGRRTCQDAVLVDFGEEELFIGIKKEFFSQGFVCLDAL